MGVDLLCYSQDHVHTSNSCTHNGIARNSNLGMSTYYSILFIILLFYYSIILLLYYSIIILLYYIYYYIYYIF